MIGRWIILAVTAALLAGCNMFARKGAPTTAPAVQAEKDPRPAEIEQLKGRIEELSARAERLSTRVTQLEFLNDQLNKQLDAIADAPRQRDLLRQRVAQQQGEIDRLNALLEEFRERLGLIIRGTTLPATTEPAPNPATTAPAEK